MTHKFTWEHTSSSISTTVEVDEDANLLTMLEAFEQYLKACGFCFDGGINIEK